MADYIKVKATNITNGPRFFNSAPPVTLQAGQSTDGEVDITAEELASMKFYGQFEIEGGPVDDTDDLSKLKVDELKDLAAKEEIDLGDATKKDDIIAAIELAREAK